jgi:MFS family permease
MHDVMTTRRTQRWVLALTAAASAMIALDQLVVATALSTIKRDLRGSLATLEWTVNTYNLSFAVLMMTAAVVGDRYGRRRMFVVALAHLWLHPSPARSRRVRAGSSLRVPSKAPDAPWSCRSAWRS